MWRSVLELDPRALSSVGPGDGSLASVDNDNGNAVGKNSGGSFRKQRSVIPRRLRDIVFVDDGDSPPKHERSFRLTPELTNRIDRGPTTTSTTPSTTPTTSQQKDQQTRSESSTTSATLPLSRLRQSSNNNIDNSSSSSSVILRSASNVKIETTRNRFHKAVWNYSPTKGLTQHTKKVVDARVAAGTATATATAAASSRSVRSDGFHDSLPSLLPKELMIHILEYVPLVDLAVVSQTCRAWFLAIDPWVFLEHHGWVPLGPLTKAHAVSVRVGADDAAVANDVFSCCVSCRWMAVELQGSGGQRGPSLALQERPLQRALPHLHTIELHKPTPADIQSLAVHVVPCAPRLRNVTLSKLALPIGARDLLALGSAALRHLTLCKVSYITPSTVVALFQQMPLLAELTLNRCGVLSARGCKAKLSCTIVCRGARTAQQEQDGGHKDKNKKTTNSIDGGMDEEQNFRERRADGAEVKKEPGSSWLSQQHLQVKGTVHSVDLHGETRFPPLVSPFLPRGCMSGCMSNGRSCVTNQTHQQFSPQYQQQQQNQQQHSTLFCASCHVLGVHFCGVHKYPATANTARRSEAANEMTGLRHQQQPLRYVPLPPVYTQQQPQQQAAAVLVARHHSASRPTPQPPNPPPYGSSSGVTSSGASNSSTAAAAAAGAGAVGGPAEQMRMLQHFAGQRIVR